ncbi:MAG: PEP-CTERM sorting domain-containing protein [Planctomyces sp.]|nr:PEP-CTERM sorting domain-containing protein [Planctomyces sp.]
MNGSFRILPRSIAALVLVSAIGSQAEAGFLVGSVNNGPGTNDNHATVLAVIQAYNAVNDPDLSEDFSLFKKTDNDAAFVYNTTNGFFIYSDAAGTNLVTSNAQLENLSEVWFKYTGDVNLLYYSAKSKHDVVVRTFTLAPGLNYVNVSPKDLSHISFWKGPTPPKDDDPPPGVQTPEPASSAMLLIGLASIAGRRGFRRLRGKSDSAA